MSNELMELASKVEALSGPDRAVDAMIGEIVGVRQLRSQDGFASMHCPDYTRSLDAAMTLVPEDGGFSVEWERPSRMCEASVCRRWGEPWGDKSFSAEAVTPALALTAAALRARSHIQGKE